MRLHPVEETKPPMDCITFGGNKNQSGVDDQKTFTVKSTATPPPGEFPWWILIVGGALGIGAIAYVSRNKNTKTQKRS